MHFRLLAPSPSNMVDQYLEALKTRLVGSVVFKCPHAGCPLMYARLLQLRKHLQVCKHDARISKCPVIECDFAGDGDVEQHLSTKHEISNQSDTLLRIEDEVRMTKKRMDVGNKEGYVDISELEGIAGDMFSFFFPEGIILYEGNGGEFVCGVPGCGKMFKQVGGYKFHFRTYSHSIVTLVREYETAKGMFIDMSTVLDSIERRIRLDEEFYVGGMIHYSYRKVDLDVPLRMMVSQLSMGNKRCNYNKRRDLRFVKLWSAGEFNKQRLEQYIERSTTPMRGGVSEILLQDRRIEVSGRFDTGGLIVHNIRECITTSSFPEKNDRYVFVGVKSKFQGESAFHFCSGPSRVYLLDQELNLKHTLDFEFGFCRKIETCQRSDVVHCVALFSDGFIRRFDFEGDVRNLRRIEVSGIIDFEIDWKYDVMLATDGLTLYQIVGDSISSSDKQKSLITSMAVREHVFGDRIMHKRENEIGSKVSSLEFYALSLDGNIAKFDFQFKGRKECCLPASHTLIKYLRHIDTMMIVDTLNSFTRIISDMRSIPKTCTIFNHAVSCCVNSEKGVVVGGFDGTVRYAQLSKKGAKSSMVLRLVRRENTVVLCCLEKEFELLKDERRLSHDYAERVVGVHLGRRYLFVVYACGVVLGLTL